MLNVISIKTSCGPSRTTFRGIPLEKYFLATEFDTRRIKHPQDWNKY